MVVASSYLPEDGLGSGPSPAVAIPRGLAQDFQAPEVEIWDYALMEWSKVSRSMIVKYEFNKNCVDPSCTVGLRVGMYILWFGAVWISDMKLGRESRPQKQHQILSIEQKVGLRDRC